MKERFEQMSGKGWAIGLTLSLFMIAIPSVAIAITGGIGSAVCLAGLVLWQC